MSRYPLLDQTVADRYVVRRFLDRGGKAYVYLADDLEQQRSVALKVLNDELSARSGAALRFEQAASLAVSLDHQNILDVTSNGLLEAGIPFYVMEHCQGWPLDQWRRGGDLPDLNDLLPLFAQLVAALRAIHRQGALHLHLKPGNIFAVPGPTVELKLANAGMCLVNRSEQGGAGPGEFAEFMAPEVRSGDGGERQPDRRSDVFSLGALVHWLVSGALPLGGKNEREPYGRRLKMMPRRLDDLREGVPPALADRVRSCLDPDPDRRPESVGQLGEELEKAIRFAPVSGIADLARQLKGLGGDDEQEAPEDEAPARAPAPGQGGGAPPKTRRRRSPAPSPAAVEPKAKKKFSARPVLSGTSAPADKEKDRVRPVAPEEIPLPEVKEAVAPPVVPEEIPLPEVKEAVAPPVEKLAVITPAETGQGAEPDPEAPGGDGGSMEDAGATYNQILTLEELLSAGGSGSLPPLPEQPADDGPDTEVSATIPATMDMTRTVRAMPTFDALEAGGEVDDEAVTAAALPTLDGLDDKEVDDEAVTVAALPTLDGLDDPAGDDGTGTERALPTLDGLDDPAGDDGTATEQALPTLDGLDDHESKGGTPDEQNTGGGATVRDLPLIDEDM